MGAPIVNTLKRAVRALLRLTGLEFGPVTLSEDLEHGTTKAVFSQRENLPYRDAVEDLKHEKEIRSLERDIVKIGAETEALGDKWLANSVRGLVEIEAAANDLTDEQIKGDILTGSREALVRAGVLAANTNLRQQEAANINATRAKEIAEMQATTSRLSDATRHVASLGPTEEERQHSEQEIRDDAWALDLADDAARMAYRLNKKAPYTDTDRYYAFVAVQFYAARLDGKERAEAIQIAARKLFDLKKRQQSISDEEARQFAERAHELHQTLSRTESDERKAEEARTRQEQELEASRNNLQAAETQLAASEKLDAVLHGRKNDGTNFDPRA